jgi:hypothetical protein
MRVVLAAAGLSLSAIGLASADDQSCVSTTFNLLSPNDKVCVSDFDDPKVPGVTCFISQARKGGWGQPLGLNEDPSNFSVACRQTGPITANISKAAREGGRPSARRPASSSRRHASIASPMRNGTFSSISPLARRSSKARRVTRSAQCRSCRGRSNIEKRSA